MHIGKGGDLLPAVQGQFAVLNALPFHMATEWPASLPPWRALLRFDRGCAVHPRNPQNRRQGRQRADAPVRLAPGFIGIVGTTWPSISTPCTTQDARGCAARYPQGSLRYNLTWSTEGLINEYINPCEALVDGQPLTVHALEGLETFALDGIEYEAFNTSGGLGSLTETWAGKARNVDYKSIRYPGHCAILKFLLNELKCVTSASCSTRSSTTPLPPRARCDRGLCQRHRLQG
ncbi:saccharopine dehydrogenase family protein [Comamonas sp. JC664]|uniref:saccharopine dehydrogenase family protein n=1 Tax=Comamonas sp. JC664 TaxID=2801917 RepID=UPI00360788B6